MEKQTKQSFFFSYSAYPYLGRERMSRGGEKKRNAVELWKLRNKLTTTSLVRLFICIHTHARALTHIRRICTRAAFNRKQLVYVNIITLWD